MRKLILCLSILTATFTGITATAAPVSANHGYHGESYCYGVDWNYHTHTEWYGNYGWRTRYYHHYTECTDGHWYWSYYEYSWERSYWVYWA